MVVNVASKSRPTRAWWLALLCASACTGGTDGPATQADLESMGQAIDLVIEKVGKGEIPGGQYGAILIDEGHDLKQEWLQLVVQMVDPDTKSLLLLYDDAQSIYANRRGLGFTLKDAGVEAQGRTTILKVNYRNTDEILRFAYSFARAYVDAEQGGGDDESVPEVIPDSAGRHGPSPVLEHFESFSADSRRSFTTKRRPT